MPLRPVIFILLLALAACDRKPVPQAATPTPAPTPKPTPTPTPTPAPTPPPTPTPVPTPYVPMKNLRTGTIFNGMKFDANLETTFGATAAAERASSESYTVEVNVKVKVPKPHQSLDDLRKLNDKLDTVLPGLAALLPTAKVSPEFAELYGVKVTSLRNNLDRLDALLSRHNFYDCETLLQLAHPQTKRHALLIQSDMDVDTDGADGDRLPTFDTTSRTYQPFTSYHWDKRTTVPNPCASIWEKKIADSEAKLKDPKTTAAEQPRIRAEISRLKSELRDLQTSSYLIGTIDPFIVLPLGMFGRAKTGFTPVMGDYCVVIADDVLYPAIIGDAGPAAKIGEASLRICKQINARASGEFRPIADLKATYLVFPGTADRPWGPPNLPAWRARCETLLNEIGGYKGTLFAWEDLSKPPAPPPPTPVTTVPAPAPAPAPATPPAPAQ